MPRHLVSLALLLLLPTAALAARRHAVSPGAGRCLYGPLADEAEVLTLALDATDVYYYDFIGISVEGENDNTNETGLLRVPKNGGLPTLLAPPPPAFVTDLVVDDTTVYFGTLPDAESGVLPPGAIYAVPKNGGPLRVVAEGVTWPVHLKVDDTHVYWASFGTYNATTDSLARDGKIERVRKDGSGRQTLVQSLSGPYDLLLDGENVLFSESGSADGPFTSGIRRVAKSGGAAVALQSTHAAADLAQTSTDIVFYGDGGSPRKIGLFRMPKSGGSVQLLVDDEEVSGGPRIVGEQVYFAVGEDLIQRVPVAGGTPQTVVATTFMNANDFEVDACGVFFGTESGQLRKAPR